MTGKILITGDRSIHPVGAVNALAQVLEALTERFSGLHGRFIITGDLPGVERAVQYLVPSVQTFAYPRDENGRPNFDAAYEDLEDDTVLAVVLHPEPLSSHLAKAVFRHFPESRVWLPLTEPATFSV
jgi:hypothetical protein